MLSQWFMVLPEILLVSFVLIAALTENYYQSKTPKTFFTMSQIFIALVLWATLVFYNKSAFPQFWRNTPLITLFKSCAYMLTWGWIYLSSKWFLNKNRPSCIFCSLIFMQLLWLDILASSSSLLTLAAIIPLIFLGNILLITRHWDFDKVKSTAFKYGLCSVLFSLALWVGIAIIYHYSGSFSYNEVLTYLKSQPHNNIWGLSSIAVLLAVFMFLLGLVPFHIWLISVASSGVLPICGFFILIPQLFYLCGFINLVRDCLMPFYWFISPVILTCTILSVIIGALSANGEKNLRVFSAYLSIYCLGMGVLGLNDFSAAAIIISFAFIIIAILSFAGIYTVFLGLKSHSEYLSDIDAIRGFSSSRPYMSAALMIFMFSFMGIAPTLGFLGYMSIMNNLIINNDWWRIGILICGMLIGTKACLDIIKAVYFEQKQHSYDRPDKSIYICLFLNMSVILLSLFNPNWLMHNAVMILGGLN